MVNRRENTGPKPEVPDIEKIEDQIPQPPTTPSPEPAPRKVEAQPPIEPVIGEVSEAVRATAEPAEGAIAETLGVDEGPSSLEQIMVSGAILETDLDTAENLIASSQEQDEPDKQSEQ